MSARARRISRELELIESSRGCSSAALRKALHLAPLAETTVEDLLHEHRVRLQDRREEEHAEGWLRAVEHVDDDDTAAAGERMAEHHRSLKRYP